MVRNASSGCRCWNPEPPPPPKQRDFIYNAASRRFFFPLRSRGVVGPRRERSLCLLNLSVNIRTTAPTLTSTLSGEMPLPPASIRPNCASRVPLGRTASRAEKSKRPRLSRRNNATIDRQIAIPNISLRLIWEGELPYRRLLECPQWAGKREGRNNENRRSGRGSVRKNF